MALKYNWKREKKRILNLPIEEKRLLYKSKSYIPLCDIDSWDKFTYNNMDLTLLKYTPLRSDIEIFNTVLDTSKDRELTGKVSLVVGDITQLEIDAIVNTTNTRLLAGGGVDKTIHCAAGYFLQRECNALSAVEHCETGDAKITGGYNLPAKYVIHTVGPRNGSAEALQSCYEKCLSFHHECDIRTIAFPCIATGVYGFSNQRAAHIALRTVRKFLEANEDMERVIFCTYTPLDVDIYKTLLQMYFPVHDWH